MDLLRKWVQGLFFFMTNGYWNFPVTRSLYKGPLKVVCSPGLNCYSCPASTTYCPIGALQQLFAGIRIALEIWGMPVSGRSKGPKRKPTQA